MRKFLKRALQGLAVIIVLALTTIWAMSEWKLRQTYEPEMRPVQPADDPASIAEGERLARIFGCHEGCHGRDMEGVAELFELPDATVIRSSNLTRLAREYSPFQLEAAIRQGIRPDGRSVVAMPSASFAILSDTHLAQILGFISGYPAHDNQPGSSRLMPLARFMLLIGEFDTSAEMMTDASQPYAQQSLSNPVTHGRYLAITACSECHGMDLGGQGKFTPALAIARGYDLEAFTRLMREGVALADRDVGLMGEMGRRRFAHFTDSEIQALFDFLVSAPIPLSD